MIKRNELSGVLLGGNYYLSHKDYDGFMKALRFIAKFNGRLDLFNKEIANSLNALQEEYDWIKDNYALLEIDVNDYNIDFYMDGYYIDQKPYIGYTYNYFPPRRIREVDNDDLNWLDIKI